MALIREPVRGSQSFAEKSDAAEMSQAAILLLMGHRLRGTHLVSQKQPVMRATMWQSVQPEVNDFPVPEIPERTTRISTARTRAQLNRIAPAHFRATRPTTAARPVSPQVLKNLADQVYASKSHEAAAQLFHACLHHSSELVRVAAAASYFELATDTQPLIDVLAKGTRSRDALTREVAGTALARFEPAHRALAPLTVARKRPRRRRKAHTGMLIHGTWARNQKWWQPGGDFHGYILANFWSDLYASSDRFEWNGGWSDAARSLGGQRLAAWIEARNAAGIKLMGHSHGANVMMLATQMTDKIQELVLLSCPVHENKYLPDFNHTAKVISYRVKLDLVILADGGGQKFSDPRIDENVLPLWFDHSATHDPQVWDDGNLPTQLRQKGY